MQHHHMLLLVNERRCAFADDEGCGQHLLLLQADVGVHPVGAGDAAGEVIKNRFAGLERRTRQHGRPVHGDGRRQPVPVDHRFFLEGIGQLHGEAAVEHLVHAMPTLFVDDPVHGGGLALDLQGAGVDPELEGRGSSEAGGGQNCGNG